MGSSFERRRTWTLGAKGTKSAPHWRHMVLFAAAYSICLKPQCGQSTLTLAGDGLATGAIAKRWLLKHGHRKPPWQEASPTRHSARFPASPYLYSWLRWSP